MAKIPKVTVTFDADLDSLKKGVKGATTEVDSFGTKVGDFSKKAALAFAAVAGKRKEKVWIRTWIQNHICFEILGWIRIRKKQVRIRPQCV